VQGGWLIAGLIVGFMYNHIGLGGVLLIDVSTYVVSFLCYFAVRKGRHVVLRPRRTARRHPRRGNPIPALLARDARGPALSPRASRCHPAGHQLGAVSGRHDHRSRGHSVAERSRFSRRRGRLRLAQRGMGHRRVSQRPLCACVIASLGGRRSVAFSMAIIAACVVCAPVSHWLVAAILLYAVMGSARGVGGIAMNTSLMEMVPQHLMGRVQNTFYFFGTFLQLVLAIAVGAVAHKVSLVAPSPFWPVCTGCRS
jgi:hypothetical protein